jgi:hypothetical protein
MARLRAALRRRATTRRWCTSSLATTLDMAAGAHPAHPAGSTCAAAGPRPEAPTLADDRARHAQGLDRAEGRWTASRSKAAGARTRCRSAGVQDPHTCNNSKTGCKSYRPRSCSTKRASCATSCCAGAYRAASAWASTRTPTAGTAAAAGDAVRLHEHAVVVRTPARRSRSDARAGRLPARGDALNLGSAQLPPLRSGRDRLQPAGGGLCRVGQGSGWPRPWKATPT